MGALTHLRQSPARKVLLTATLVPEHQEVLAESVGVTLGDAIVLRSPTARPNHKIQITSLSSPDETVSVGLQLGSLLLKTWSPDQKARGIMFVRTLSRLTQVSTSSPFPVCTYHGGMCNEDKENQLSSWLSDEHSARWMVATTALLHGVDHPRIDSVIFLESPYGVYDFVQGAGRAGRSGQESLVVILHNGPPLPMDNESPYACRVEMGTILSASACRRTNISKVMDGVELSCSQVPSSLPCDFCEGQLSPLLLDAISAPSMPIQSNPTPRSFTRRAPPKPSSTALLRGYSAQFAAGTRDDHARSVKNLMDQYSGCFTCRISSPDHSPCHHTCGNSSSSGCRVTPHNIYECTDFKYKMGWIDWKKTFSWPKDAKRCFYCGLPFSAAPFGHREGKFPGRCQYSDSALAAAWHVLHSPQLFKKLQKELGFVPGVDPKASFGVWVMQYGSDSQEIGLLSVFSWLCSQYYPKLPST